MVLHDHAARVPWLRHGREDLDGTQARRGEVQALRRHPVGTVGSPRLAAFGPRLAIGQRYGTQRSEHSVLDLEHRELGTGPVVGDQDGATTGARAPTGVGDPPAQRNLGRVDDGSTVSHPKARESLLVHGHEVGVVDEREQLRCSPAPFERPDGIFGVQRLERDPSCGPPRHRGAIHVQCNGRGLEPLRLGVPPIPTVGALHMQRRVPSDGSRSAAHRAVQHRVRGGSLERQHLRGDGRQRISIHAFRPWNGGSQR